MPGCAAPNCTNHSKRGYQFHRFPADPIRRRQWLINSRRANWIPKSSDRLCSAHFEYSQYEQSRADGKKLLSPFAIPTIFNATKPSKLRADCKRRAVKIRNIETEDGIDKESLESTPEPKRMRCQPVLDLANVTPEINDPQLSPHKNIHENVDNTEALIFVYNEENVDECAALKEKISILNTQLQRQNEALASFLTRGQIAKLTNNKSTTSKWSAAEIEKALKFRFALGKNGYHFLCATKYPLPTYSTLHKRVASVKIEFGMLSSIVDLLPEKVQCMVDIDKDCSVMFGDMEISGSTTNFIVTLGDREQNATHLTVASLDGLNSPWKQVIACHVTGPSTGGSDRKRFTSEVIQTAHSVGLRPKIVCSNMATNNRAMWSAMGVAVNRSKRQTSFIQSLEESTLKVHVIADAPHLLKNWKVAIEKCQIHIPRDVAEANKLPTDVVSGKYIKQLRNIEMKKRIRLRSLHHLNVDIIEGGDFSKNIASAMRYISVKTADALEAAVKQRILPRNALTTAWFLRMLRRWFDLVNSRTRTASITKNNFKKKQGIIESFVKIIEQTVIDKGWKPLNNGTILTSLSFMEVATQCFESGYRLLLGSRLSQDALENICAQIRKKAGGKPSALDALRVLKLICVSQYMSDTKNTNY